MHANFSSQAMNTIFDRYARAWTARDPDRIVELHTPGTMFWLRLDRSPVTGRHDVRAAFAQFFEQWPDFGLEVRQLRVGPDHWVLDWTLTSMLPRPDGGRRPVQFDCLDVVVVEASGLVQRKDTFVDFLQVQQALGSGTAS